MITPMWTLEEAQQLVAQLEPLVREQNYHTLLGGGVLHKGSSDKDLDLVFIPLNGYPSEPYKILLLLTEALGPSRSLRDSPDYQGENRQDYHYEEAQAIQYQGKRIDIFIQ